MHNKIFYYILDNKLVMNFDMFIEDFIRRHLGISNLIEKSKNTDSSLRNCKFLIFH